MRRTHLTALTLSGVNHCLRRRLPSLYLRLRLRNMQTLFKMSMYREKQFNEQSSRYRPVDSVVTSKQVLYEAPPPYDFGTSRTSATVAPPPATQQSHDWHCLLENEVNDSRQVSGS
ncbi:hypothetical protein L596_006086 [Steinernema carpocapsae]|uniref:Uncharacterized protein n=1 Tax=Steinernema carpocapsae TaxID=34508 RepID=A0A4U8V6G9_STECR|nr:hypothetical protein L596_006086 [Steinernema carpocapsae]